MEIFVYKIMVAIIVTQVDEVKLYCTKYIFIKKYNYKSLAWTTLGEAACNIHNSIYDLSYRRDTQL